MTRIAAVILAGGRGERLGGINKALIEIGGRRLVDRAMGAVQGCDPLLLAVGGADFDLAGPIHVPDLASDYAGPLAGVAAAVARLLADPPDLLLSLAVDTPFFPADFLERALPRIAGHSVVLAAFAGQDYPTNALWRFDSIRLLPAGLADSTAPHSLKRLAATIGATRLDYADHTDFDPFLNANTPEELENLRSRAARKA